MIQEIPTFHQIPFQSICDRLEQGTQLTNDLYQMLKHRFDLLDHDFKFQEKISRFLLNFVIAIHFITILTFIYFSVLICMKMK